jgi:hypothetical protein
VEFQEPRYLMIAGSLYRELSATEFRKFLDYSPEYTKLMVDYFRKQRPEIVAPRSIEEPESEVESKSARKH